MSKWKVLLKIYTTVDTLKDVEKVYDSGNDEKRGFFDVYGKNILNSKYR